MEAGSCGNTVSISRRTWSMDPWPEHCQAWWIIFEHIGLFPNLPQHCQAWPIMDGHCCRLLIFIYLVFLKAFMLWKSETEYEKLPQDISNKISVNLIIVWLLLSDEMQCYFKYTIRSIVCEASCHQAIRPLGHQAVISS